jgi:phosphomevalonate kinase
MNARAVARAPGKVMLTGEYAVLEGSVALVMAVDRYAEAVADEATALDERDGWRTPELEATLALAREEGLVRPTIEARVRPATLFDGPRKLGLGSSAAMCVAGLFAVLRASGADCHDEETRMRATRVALRGHRQAQGGGSGTDVFASALGGVFATVIEGGEARTFERLSWPASVFWRVLWTGTPVSTRDFVVRVRALSTTDEPAYRASMDRIRRASEGFLEAMRAGDGDALVAHTDEHGDAMQRLGERAGVPIVTDVMQRLRARASQLRCAVKPSGAGGGDIVLAVATDPAALDALVHEARAWDVSDVRCSVDAHGARAE